MGVAFSPDGQQLAVAAGNIVTLWDPTSRHIITTLTSSADPLLADRAGAPLVTTSNVAYSSDGHHLASTTTYATVTLWDTTTGQASVLHPVDIPAEVLPSAIQIALRFSPDGRTLATGDSVEGTILWDTATGHLISRLSNSPTAVEAVAFSPTEPLLAVTSTSGDTQLWELPSDRHTTTLSSEDHTELGHVIDIAFSPTDPTLATVGEDGTIRLWNINGNALSAHPLTALHGLAISPDGTTLATGNAEGTVTLWNTTTHHQTAVLTGHTGAITSVAFSPDGHALASASADHTAVMWNLATQARTVTFREPGPVQEVLFSRNGRVLAMGTSDGTIDIREVATGAAAVSPPASVLVITALAGLALGPDGQTVAVAGSGANTPQPPALQYLTSGEAASIMAGSDAGSHHSSASRAAFSTDGRTAAVARDDGTVQLLDANNGIGQTAIVTGHSGAVTGVAFSPDDQTLAIASADGSVILWDIASNQPVATLTGHAGSVNGVVFSPRGQSLATIGDDGTARLWDLNANHVISQLCRSIASNSDSPHQQVQLTPDLSAHANCR
jgi:WD40 repeat protein